MQKQPLPGLDPFKESCFKGLDPLMDPRMSTTSLLRAQNINTNFQVPLPSQT